MATATTLPTPDRLPGVIRLTRLADGSQGVKVESLADEITTTLAREILKLGKTRVNELCDEGKLEWRWSSDMKGKRLIKAASVVAYIERLTQFKDTGTLPVQPNAVNPKAGHPWQAQRNHT